MKFIWQTKFKVPLAICAIVFFLNNCSNGNNPASIDNHDDYVNASLEIKSFDPLDSTTNSDYLIITDKELINPGLKLAEYRRVSPFDEVSNPRVILTQTIDSNYFSFDFYQQISIIKNAIWNIETNWKNKPKYIVLFADAQIKPRLFSGIPIPDSSLFADLYYAGMDSINVPNVILGRIPASTEMEALNYVSKIIIFEAHRINKMLTITDDKWIGTTQDPIDFEEVTQDICSQLVTLPVFSLPISKYRLGNFSTADTLPLTMVQKTTANLALIDSLNTGNKLVTFLGHAGYQLFTEEHIITVYDIEKLKSIDVWVSLGCNSNQYSHEDSFAKQLLQQSESGAVAFIAPYLWGYPQSGKMLRNGA